MNEAAAEMSWLGELAKPVDTLPPQQLPFYGSLTAGSAQHDPAVGDPDQDHQGRIGVAQSVDLATAVSRTGSTRRICAEQVDSVIALLDAVPPAPARNAGEDVGLALFGARFDDIAGDPEPIAPVEAEDVAAEAGLTRTDQARTDQAQTDQGQTQTGLTQTDQAQSGETRISGKKRLISRATHHRFRYPLLIGVVGALALTVAGTSAGRTSTSMDKTGMDKTGAGAAVLVGTATHDPTPASPARALAAAGAPAPVLASTGLIPAPNRVANRSRPIPIAGAATGGVILRTVRLTDAGTVATSITTGAKTVAALLTERRITLSSLDKVSPAPTTKLADGLVITVNRVVVTSTSTAVTLPQPAAKTVSDASLVKGSSDVVQQGRPGRELITYAVTTVNGKQTSKVITGRVTVVAPTGAITHLGTKSSFTYAGAEVFTNDTSFGVNWDGLSMCESTHNPQAINANPSAGLPTYGLFQFDLPTWASVGGSGNPIDASPEEQLMRAKLLFQQRGLEPWACRDAAH